MHKTDYTITIAYMSEFDFFFLVVLQQEHSNLQDIMFWYFHRQVERFELTKLFYLKVYVIRSTRFLIYHSQTTYSVGTKLLKHVRYLLFKIFLFSNIF